MARRVPLPRLTHRQRMARWQRERRQQAIYITAFTAVLVFVLGLSAWAAASSYYDSNVAPAARINGQDIPKREYRQQYKYDLVKVYVENGVPAGSENDPQVQQLASRYADIALAQVIERHVLDLAAQGAGIHPTQEQIDAQYVVDFGEVKLRHILVQPDPKATDPAAADAAALAKARDVAEQLKKAPNDADLWKKLAKEDSSDPGSKDAGGELGWSSHGQYVPEFENAVRALAIGQVSDPVRTQFGYHVIQVEARRDPSQTDLVKAYLSHGYSVADLHAHARYDHMRDVFGKREQGALLGSPQEQVHLAKITVNIPLPSSKNYQQFGAALQKQTTIQDALKAGKDFAELAKTDSDDSATKDKGGDMGWVTRGMLTDPQTESVVFSTAAGKVTDPVSTTTEWTIYKVLEKDASRALSDDQKIQIKDDAYEYWYQRQKQADKVTDVLPGVLLQ